MWLLKNLNLHMWFATTIYRIKLQNVNIGWEITNHLVQMPIFYKQENQGLDRGMGSG